MIHVNLLAPERDHAKRRSPGLPLGQRVTVACTLILVAAGLGVLWWWWALERQSTRLDADIVAAQRETARLKTLITQVETFEKQKQQLQQRVALIEELRQGQSIPVHLLDQLSRALPDMLWLTDLKQDPSGELTIEGRCATLTALSDFVGNLEQSQYFSRPVEIIDSQVEPAAPPAGELIKFSVKAKFGPAAGAAPAAVPARAPVTR
jgi:type IV pilus assembly protein PilN